LPSNVNQKSWSGVPFSSANQLLQNGNNCLSPVVTLHDVDSGIGVEADIKLLHSNYIYSAPMYNTQSNRKQSQSSYDYLSSISEGSDSVAGNEKANKNKVLPNEVGFILLIYIIHSKFITPS